MAVKKISKVQPEKFEFNNKNKETADSSFCFSCQNEILRKLEEEP